MKRAVLLGLTLVVCFTIPSVSAAPQWGNPPVIASDSLAFSLNDTTFHIPCEWTKDPQVAYEDISRAVIVIHGNARTAVSYWTSVDAAASSAGADSTQIIAPQFLVESDVDTAGLGESILYWETAGQGRAWKRGNQSWTSTSHPRSENISSFAVVDSLVLLLAANNSNLRNIVITGHSAGGQFVNRYAAGSSAEEALELTHPNIDVSYVVANPSSYLYLDNRRLVPGTVDEFAVPTLPDSCDLEQHYNSYRFGLASRLNPYMQNARVDSIRAQYKRRNVTYFLGDADSTGHAAYCAANVQGYNRFHRGITYFNYLADYYSGSTYLTQNVLIAPGVDHDGAAMYQSDQGKFILFDVGTASFSSLVIEPGGPLTIQAAIDFRAHAENYTLVLMPGTYSGHGNRDITYVGKAIKVRSLDGNPATCIINCGGVGRGFRFISLEGRDSILEGVTITEGWNGDSGGGGGILFVNTSPTIRSCILRNNTATRGGGMSLDNASPEITSTTLHANSAPQGSGIYAVGSSPILTKSIIAFGLLGEAFWTDGTPMPSVESSNFYGNAGGDWTGPLAGYGSLWNNQQVDPLFCNAPAMDLTLCKDSPCFSAYSPSGFLVGAQDTSCAECRPPTVTASPSNVTVCEGGLAMFSVVADGAPTLTYQWRKDSVDISGATLASYTIDPVDSADAGGYDVVVTNDSGSETSSAAILTVDMAPVVTIHPLTQTLCEGDSATISVTATGTPPLSYQWRMDGGDIFGADQSFFKIASASETAEGDYDVIVTNHCGVDTSNVGALTVDEGPVITAHPQDVEECTGEAVAFTVTATGLGPISYQWRKDGLILSGDTSNSLTLDPIGTGSEGAYDVIVSNPCAFTLSSAGSLTVLTGPTITEHPQGDYLCFPFDNPLPLHVSAVGEPPLSYQWRKNGQNISGATDSTYSVPSVAASSDDFDVVVTDACGSTTSNAATVTLALHTPPSISTTHLFEACEGETYKVFVSSALAIPPATYQWRKDGVPLTDGGRFSGSLTDTLRIEPLQIGDEGLYDVVATNLCSIETSNQAPLNTIWPLVLHVPGDYASIQQAIDAVCPDGGTVILADGYYTNELNTDFNGKAITVRSASSNPDLCVIDCGQLGRAFQFTSGEGSDSKLEGITIMNGDASSGGAIFCGFGSSPRIENCIFDNNMAHNEGGAIACNASSPTIVDCIFENNTSETTGGAVGCWSGASPTITGCTFRNNLAPLGGAVSTVLNSEPALSFCTFYQNQADDGSSLFFAQASYGFVDNCIISFGISTVPGVGTPVLCSDSSGPALSCIDVFGNDGGDYVGYLAGRLGMNNNFSANPEFCFSQSLVYDLTLSETSPCLPQNSPCSEQVGAHGHGCGGCVATIPVIYVDEYALGPQTGESWDFAIRDLQDALALVSEDCPDTIEIWVAAGTYYPSQTGDRDASFELVNGIGIYGGFSGSETYRYERDWSTWSTTLSGDIGIGGDAGDNSYHVTRGRNGTDSTAVLDGFTITKGNANGLVGYPDGAGMFNYGGSPTVSNVIFADNHCTYYGGALFNYNSSHPRLTNVIFWNNSTPLHGGAVQNRNNSSPTYLNVTFYGNTALRGAAMHNFNNSNPTIINTVMWGNTAAGGNGEIENDSSSPVISHSLIEGSGGSTSWNSGFGTDGGNNLDADPLFKNPGVGDFHVYGDSPTCNSGNSSAPGLPLDDLDGRNRIVPPEVDMGAYEHLWAQLLSPGPVYFDPVPGHETTCDTISIHNMGDALITIYSIEGGDTAPFSIDTTMTDHTLVSGQSTTMFACVTPWESGPLGTWIILNSDSWESPDSIYVALGTVTSVGPDTGGDSFEILSVSPNPFYPSADIRFSLTEAMTVTAEIWSVTGARVRTLVDNQPFGPGVNELTWDGRNQTGLPSASGMYFIRIKTESGSKTARAVLLK